MTSDSARCSRILLEEFGCRVIAANSGEQGLRTAREFQPHIITVDLLMPNLNGWQVVPVDQSRAAARDIPWWSSVWSRARIAGAFSAWCGCVAKAGHARGRLLAVLHRIPQRHKLRVLVVDDDADARRILTSYLEADSAEVYCQQRSRALVALEQVTPDLVLLDLMMPVMDGLGFLSVIRADPRSASARGGDHSQGVDAGGSGAVAERDASVLNKAEVFGEGDFKRLLEEMLRDVRSSPVSAVGRAPDEPRSIPVLIVDDDPVFALFVLRQLVDSLGGEMPCVSEWVDTGEKALLEIQRQPYELVRAGLSSPRRERAGVLAQIQEFARRPATGGDHAHCQRQRPPSLSKPKPKRGAKGLSSQGRPRCAAVSQASKCAGAETPHRPGRPLQPADAGRPRYNAQAPAVVAAGQIPELSGRSSRPASPLCASSIAINPRKRWRAIFSAWWRCLTLRRECSSAM